MSKTIKTKEQLSQDLYDLTYMATDTYFETFKDRDTFDKQLWAFLHLGFVTALQVSGYKEDFINQVLKLTREKMVETGLSTFGKINK